MHVILPLPQTVDDQYLAKLAATRGVVVRPLSPYYAGRERRKGLLLGFSAFNSSEITLGLSAVEACGTHPPFAPRLVDLPADASLVLRRSTFGRSTFASNWPICRSLGRAAPSSPRSMPFQRASVEGHIHEEEIQAGAWRTCSVRITQLTDQSSAPSSLIFVPPAENADSDHCGTCCLPTGRTRFCRAPHYFSLASPPDI